MEILGVSFLQGLGWTLGFLGAWTLLSVAQMLT